MHVCVLLHAMYKVCDIFNLMRAVSDMFYDKPFSLDANDQACVDRFGIHVQYNWAAYKWVFPCSVTYTTSLPCSVSVEAHKFLQRHAMSSQQ